MCQPQLLPYLSPAPPVAIPILRYEGNGVLRIGRQVYSVQVLPLGRHPELPGPGVRVFLVGECGDTHTFRLGTNAPAKCVCPDGERCKLILLAAIALALPSYAA